MAIGDLTGDGRADLATADTSSDQVTLLTQDADGGFAASLAGAVGDDPPGLAIADFTGDGALDVVTIDGLSWGVSLLTNDGSGAFSGSTLGATTGRPINLAVGDLNGDGRPDVAASNWLSDTVTVFLSGATPGSYTVSDAGPSAARPMGIALGDVDGDGRVDIVTSGYDSRTVEALVARADGGFDRTVLATDVGDLNDVQTADLDGDGRLDLVVSDQTTRRILLLAKEPTGPGYTERELATTASPVRRLAIGDVNGDGTPDVVAAEQAGTVSVMTNDGETGRFDRTTIGSANGIAAGMTLGDVDGDGRIDVATANPLSHTVSVFLNRTPRPDPVDPGDTGTPLDPGGPGDAGPGSNDGPRGPLTPVGPGRPVAPDSCPVGGLELVGVASVGGSQARPRVRLTGVAEASLAGRSVTALRNGAPVGTATVRDGGAVTLDVAAPRATRAAARARYQLAIDGRRSRALRAARRVTVTAQSTLASGRVRVRGALDGVSRQRTLTVRATPFCGSAGPATRRIRSDRRGRFSVTLAAPAAGSSALVYRVFDGTRTVTLPIVVGAR